MDNSAKKPYYHTSRNSKSEEHGFKKEVTVQRRQGACFLKLP